MRYSKILLLAIMFIVVQTSTLFAQSVQTGGETDGCSNQQTQTDMNICAGESLRAADADLNADYKLARDEMRVLDSYLDGDNKGAAKALLTAQRLWIKYRDAACEVEGFSVRGGSMEPLIVASCLERLTRLRSQGLGRLLERN